MTEQTHKPVILEYVTHIHHHMFTWTSYLLLRQFYSFLNNMEIMSAIMRNINKELNSILSSHGCYVNDKKFDKSVKLQRMKSL